MAYNNYVSQQYVTEEQDSDSEGSDEIMQQVADVTELYRRKHQVVNQHRKQPPTYYHTHVPGYYDQHGRASAPCSCNVQLEPRYYYRAFPPNSELMFRSSTQIPRHTLKPEPKTISSSAIKKYPITARTPKFYRNTVTQLCKRPSALCLPVTCQPDPAFHHRPRKVQPDIQHYRGQEATPYAINNYVMKGAFKKNADTRTVDSEGDVSSTMNNLESLLTKLDDDDDDEDDDEEDENDEAAVEIRGVKDISKILKPKVPDSLKTKLDKGFKLKAVKSNHTETIHKNVNKLEVQKAPEEPLQVILKRLNQETGSRSGEKRDIHEKQKQPASDTKPAPVASSNKKRLLTFLDQKPPLDDNSALELHKSKSYIVSLIDKALSKELGTIPGDKCTRKEFLSMSPKKAVDLVNRHCDKPAMEQDGESSKNNDKQCVCKTRTKEPLYLKQLKELRWSHLRHIQREAKRLADLERFLDSFNESDP